MAEVNPTSAFKNCAAGLFLVPLSAEQGMKSNYHQILDMHWPDETSGQCGCFTCAFDGSSSTDVTCCTVRVAPDILWPRGILAYRALSTGSWRSNIGNDQIMGFHPFCHPIVQGRQAVVTPFKLAAEAMRCAREQIELQER